MAETDLFKWYAPFDAEEGVEKNFDENGKKFYVGVASSTSVDRDNERMSKEVLMKAQKQLVGKPVFFNHNHKALGVGKIVDSWTNDKYLMIKMQPTQAVSMQDVVTQMEEGILKGFSVGGKALKKESGFDGDREIKIIKEADFMEVSVVGIPANPEAEILGHVAKGLNLSSNEEPEVVAPVEKSVENVIVLEPGQDITVGGDVFVALEKSKFARVTKARFATSSNDEFGEVKGDGGELEEKKPVVPPKKKKQKEGAVTDDEIYESAKREKGGDVEMEKEMNSCKEHGDYKGESCPKCEKKEDKKSAEVELEKDHQIGTPNKPASFSEEDLNILVEAVLRRIKQPVAPISVNTQGAPKAAGAEVEMQKAAEADLQKLADKIEKLDEKAVKPAGLVEQTDKFSSDVFGFSKTEIPVIEKAYKKF